MTKMKPASLSLVSSSAAAAPGPTELSLRDVRLEYPARKRGGDPVLAIDTISFEVPNKEFAVIVGPSGCGKSSLLYLIAGLAEPTAGEILLSGKPVTRPGPDRGMVFQSYTLFPWLTVRENVAFGLKRRKVSKDEIKTRVDEALDLVQLPSRSDARPRELSGGQKQRVALARALVNRPSVLLLDEPLGALDLKLRRQMQVELKQIQREVGITFVYVTHDQEEALSMSDRIAVMDSGEVRQCGEPEDVYEHPGGEFVAGFIGISNLIEGTVEDGNQVRIGSGALLRAPLPENCDRGSTVQLSVRPEKIAVDDDIEPDMVSLEGTVESRVYLGVSTQITVALGGGGRLVALEQATYRASADDRWEPGMAVRLGWHPENCLVLR
jgi:spermidine/putrescine transport system ATP-binding protein